MSPFATEQEAMAALPFQQYRAWRAEHVLKRPFPLRRTAKRKPVPGVLDLADEEVG